MCLRRIRLVTSVLICAALVSSVSAATTFHFTSITEGTYAARSSGTAVVDGKRWRITFDAPSDAFPDLTSIIGSENGELIALDAARHTWFRLPSRQRLASDTSLFRFDYGRDFRPSKIRVTVTPSSKDGMTVVAFSYRFEAKVGSEPVSGEVRGELRLWMDSHVDGAPPWKALDLTIGNEQVDAAFQQALANLGGASARCEIEVTRQLDGGEALRQVTRRTISEVTAVTSEPAMFAVPADYRYGEPVIGAPGH